MTSEKASRKDKNQNIQVFVRLRPLNQREKDIRSLGVVSVPNNREVVIQSSHAKKFTFDQVFGPHARQVEVYQHVVSPLIEEVLAGYNCTVFAYGQTGTGKTHTMVGEHSGDETTWQNDPLAGIIPRALSQLFDELRISNTEYTVRVSYLELYNEELFDLLSSSEDNSKLRIYEDVTRKGSNIVNGLEEITVYNKNEVYKIMAQGQERKRVASTLMNAQSSRSHTVFTIVIHMKENSPEGEELVKIGKLNLVDLAGSENISKAGSDNPAKKERARECVNINQSLLTLGRVITALVERHPHIPYRESKLTRILQESLGGRTKTSIIATISPGHKDLEETMSTLEYANRAKNIQNKPEVNQKMTKKAILKEYAEEIDRLKRDLQAARDKNGVYLANETYMEMTLKEEEQKKEIQDLLLKKRAMEEERDRMESIFSDLNQVLDKKDTELKTTKCLLNSTKEQLGNTKNLLRTTKLHYEEQKQLVSAQQATEQQLSSQAKELLAAAEVAASHVATLHDNVDRRRTVESSNLEVTKTYREQSAEQREHITVGAENFARGVTAALKGINDHLESHTNSTSEIQQQNVSKLDNMVERLVDAVAQIKSQTSVSHTELTQMADGHHSELQSSVDQHSVAVETALRKFVETVASCVQQAQGVDVKGNVARFVQQWYTGMSARLASVQRAHVTFGTRVQTAESNRSQSAQRHRDTRKNNAERRNNRIQTCLAEIQEEKALIEKRLSKQLCDIENERKETEIRLNEWMEEERRLLEERLSRHVENEKRVLEERLKKKFQEIEEEKMLLENRIKKYIEWQETQIEANTEDIKMADDTLEDCEKGKEECLKYLDKYNKEFDDGSSAISTDFEVFNTNIVQVVEHITGELIEALLKAKDSIQEEVSTVVQTDKQTSKQFVDNTRTMLRSVVDSSQRAAHTFVHSMESNTTTMTAELTDISTSTSSLVSSAQSHLASQSETLEALQAEVERYHSGLKEEVERQAELEGRFLMREYKVYSPSGKTPIRQEYRYPRTLAATSPHERILARFRAMRQNTHDEDCVVIESDSEGRQASDSESSVSEDSAVAFAAPSPPDKCLLKSTSETEIYVRSKQQGKENAVDRSMNCKKPSRLRVPTSHKKPLGDRN